MTEKLKYTESYLIDCIDRRGQWYEDKLCRLKDSLKSNDITRIKEDIEFVLKVTNILPKD